MANEEQPNQGYKSPVFKYPNQGNQSTVFTYPNQNNQSTVFKYPNQGYVSTVFKSPNQDNKSTRYANQRYENNIFFCFATQDKETSFIRNLSNALRLKGFNLLMIDLAIERDSGGDHISTSVLKVLLDCKRSIVVITRNFAASPYCLALLVHIHECKKAMNQLIFPIFYGVNPVFVKYRLEWFGDAFEKHYANNGGRSSQKVWRWEDTLFEVGKERRWYIKNGLGDEYEKKLIQETVQAIVHPAPRFDVFLSFCGEDTRHSFTGYLYRALCRKGLKTFMDDEVLVSGNEISKELLEAIESSKLAIVVFSENYAYSTWCLDEFVKIIECMKNKTQLVLPIFYKVQREDVCYQTNSYGDALTAHEKKFGKNSNEVQKWRSALSQVISLKGEHNPKDDYEHEFVKRIVEMACKDVAVFKSMNESVAKMGEKEDDSDLREYLKDTGMSYHMIKDGPVIVRDPAKWGPSWKPRLAPPPDH